MRNWNAGRGWMFAFVLAGLLALPAVSLAQAWVPAQGQGGASLDYQFTRVKRHLFSWNEPAGLYLGDVFGQSVELSVDYGILPRLAASASVSYVNTKFDEPGFIDAEGPYDDGTYHGDFQDVTLGARYMIPWRGFAITPQVGGRFPMKDYQTFGHASIGTGLREFSLGASLGRSFGPWLPAGFFQGSYVHAFIENLHGFSLDRNRYTLGLGYFVNRTLSVGGSFGYFATADGINWLAIETDEEFMDHDVAARARALDGGAHVSWSRGALSTTLSYEGTIRGETAHAANAVTLTQGWNFSTPFGR